MARSLTVSHAENLTVNWLFAGFLMVAVGWLMLSTLTATAEADAASMDDQLALEAGTEINDSEIAVSKE